MRRWGKGQGSTAAPKPPDVESLIARSIARMTFPDKAYVSLEDPDARMTAESDPRGFLADVERGAILDEIQRLPSLLSYIQTMVDMRPGHGRFILTESHQPELHAAVSQSLAGRSAILTLWPFSFHEMGQYAPTQDPFELIVKGCHPRLYEEGIETRRFFNSYTQTYVERDVRALLALRTLSAFQRFLKLIAGRIGQVVNLASVAGDAGVSVTTIRTWLSVLEATYLIFLLPPYFENVRKRVVRSPKIYFTDAGLAAFFLGIHTPAQVKRDPLRGALYENLVVSEITKCALNRGIRPDLHFYRDSHGNEVDCIIREGDRLVPVEIKSGATFSGDFTRGLRQFREAVRENARPGVVLYNGERDMHTGGVHVFNPLSSDDVWASLVEQG